MISLIIVLMLLPPILTSLFLCIGLITVDIEGEDNIPTDIRTILSVVKVLYTGWFLVAKLYWHRRR